MRSAAKILWQEIWTACWSCFLKTTTSSPERGVFLQSQFLPVMLLFFFIRLVLMIPPVVTPHSHSDFQAYTRAKKNKSYICKPDTGCQGKGIFITKSYKDIPQEEHMICQVYISRVSVCSTTHRTKHRNTLDKHVFNLLYSLSLLMDTSLICVSTSWWHHVTHSGYSCSRRAWSASAPLSTMNQHTAMWSETFIFLSLKIPKLSYTDY